MNGTYAHEAQETVFGFANWERICVFLKPSQRQNKIIDDPGKVNPNEKAFKTSKEVESFLTVRLLFFFLLFHFCFVAVF